MHKTKQNKSLVHSEKYAASGFAPPCCSQQWSFLREASRALPLFSFLPSVCSHRPRTLSHTHPPFSTRAHTPEEHKRTGGQRVSWRSKPLPITKINAPLGRRNLNLVRSHRGVAQYAPRPERGVLHAKNQARMNTIFLRM